MRHRFCVLVPAYNEERLIATTLRSVAACDYPADRVEVHVVADNCTDGTAAVVRAHGVEAHEREDAANAGKGPALTWLLARLDARGETYDAAVFVDADTTVAPAFLRVADELLARGATVIQGYYAVRDPGASSSVGFRAAALAARHYLRPLGRTQLGGSAGLYGNGMVFRAEALRRHGWSGHLTEDIELHLRLLLDGTKVAFAPDAVVEAEMPATLEAARSQHERWERGRLDLARRFVPALVVRTAAGGPPGRAAAAHAAADQLMPPFSVVVAASGALAIASVGRAYRWPCTATRRRMWFALAGLGAHAAYVLSALRMVDAPVAVYRSLARAPQLVAWKLALWARVVRGRDVAWVRTARNDEVQRCP